MNRNGRLREPDTHPWRIVGTLIGMLILAIAGAGILAFLQNNHVKEVTERALRYDLEVEDEGDDLRVAVLNVRHNHRDILFYGPSRTAIANFERAYAAMLEEIGELEQLQIDDPSVPQPSGIRERAERYYAEFRPAINLYSSDPEAFRRASDEGLLLIEELDNAADEIEKLGEELTAGSINRVDEATTTEQLILIGLEVGVVLMSVVLALSAGNIFRRLHASYGREQAAAAELTRTLRIKTDFIADASHELRTPLTIIKGNAEIGLATSDPGIQREVLGEILVEVTRMSELVNDLLFLARSDAGRPPLEKELVPARWLLVRIAKPAEVLAQQHSSCLTVEPGGAGYLDVDPARIQQAVLNLVDNAAKHAPPETCVSLTSRVQNDHLVIEVADTGPGIPPHELPLIFERFYRVGGHHIRKKEGSGLGLAITKSIVEAHGGAIEVNSRVFGGTQVTIRLPLNTASVLEAASKELLAPGGGSAHA